MVKPRTPRTWSWAPDAEAVAERQAHVSRLVGQQLVGVNYFTIDYNREHLRPGDLGAGPRAIVDAVEQNDPTWRYDGFDSIDYGLELRTAGGELWSITWDPPGQDMEGIGLRAAPMLGVGVAVDADVAIWETTDSPAWSGVVGGTVQEVELRYMPWSPEAESLWCPRISLTIGPRVLEIILGDADHPSGALVPSADNVAVLHPGTPLPAWHLGLDSQR